MSNHIKWDNSNPFPEGSEELLNDVAKAIRLRAIAKGYEDEAKKMKKEADTLARVILPILGGEVKSNLGNLTLYESERSTVNNAGVKEYLLSKNVPPQTIAAAWRNNTTTKTSQSVRFTAPKK